MEQKKSAFFKVKEKVFNTRIQKIQIPSIYTNRGVFYACLKIKFMK